MSLVWWSTLGKSWWTRDNLLADFQIKWKIDASIQRCVSISKNCLAMFVAETAVAGAAAKFVWIAWTERTQQRHFFFWSSKSVWFAPMFEHLLHWPRWLGHSGQRSDGCARRRQRRLFFQWASIHHGGQNWWTLSNFLSRTCLSTGETVAVTWGGGGRRRCQRGERRLRQWLFWRWRGWKDGGDFAS